MSDTPATTRTVNEVVPPRCERCERALVTREELNRRIDLALDLCDHCWTADIEDDCWCVYGWYLGGDPRQFQPDEENSAEEIAAWRAACTAWEQGRPVEPAAEEHGPWVDPETGAVTLGEQPSPAAVGVCHATRAYGQGEIYCEQHAQPADAWKSWPLQRADLEVAP